MTFTITALEAERMALLNGEETGDVLAWLTSPITGTIPTDWDDEE